MKKRVATLLDLAEALGISTGTVHRALHNHPDVNALTKTRVLQMAKSMQYRPNVAARNLARRRHLRISVNTPKGATSFWDEVRAGIQREADSQNIGGSELEFRTYPKMGTGEAEAFEGSMDSRVNGIITFPSNPLEMRNWMKRATKAHVPVVCVATDAPNTGRLAVVSIDTMVSGSLAADLLGRILRGKGKVAVTMAYSAISEHAEKSKAFTETLRKYHPEMVVVESIEEHGVESEAYEKGLALFNAHPDLAGIYVTTEASIPILNAARDSGILPRLSVVTTDLFPALVSQIREGHVIGTIDQRPFTQGRLAFRVLHQFLIEGSCPSYQVLLSPHLVMRGNLDFFLRHQSLTSIADNGPDEFIDSAVLEGYSLG
jgi:LacI family transcriptional regulator